MNLLHWLKKTPQPAAVIADDQTITVPRNARAFRDLTATIKALAPSKLTCVDKDGHVIRSVVLEEDAAADDRAAPSPEMNDLQVFARLLAEGYDRGARTNQPLVDRAMEFVERNSERLAKAEAEIDRLRAQLHKVSAQYAELLTRPAGAEPELADGGDTLMGAVVAGVLQAQGLVPKPVSAPVTPINKSGAAKK